MSAITEAVVPLSNTGRFFIHGEWTKPTSDAVIDVIDSATEQLYFQFPKRSPRIWTWSSVPHVGRSTVGRGHG